MSPDAVMDLTRRSIWIMVEIGAPTLIAALVVGVVISVLQAMTQIQESTLSFLPKLVVILVAQAITLPFALSLLGDFTRMLFGRVAAMGGL